MRLRIEILRGPQSDTWEKMARCLAEFTGELLGRYGSLSPVEATSGRTFRDYCGGVIGRMTVVDGKLGDPEPQLPPKPYRLEHAERELQAAIDDIRLLSTKPKNWRDVAGTAAVNLRVLAGMLDAARTGFVGVGEDPIAFPKLEGKLEGK